MMVDDDFSGVRNQPQGGSHQHQSAAEGVNGDEDSLMTDEDNSQLPEVQSQEEPAQSTALCQTGGLTIGH